MMSSDPNPSPAASWSGTRVPAQAPAQRLWHWVTHTPQRPALVTDSGEVIDFAGLGQRVLEAAQGLRRQGVRPGDRVVSCQGRSVDAVAALWATWHCAAVWAPLSAQLPAQARQDALHRLRPRCVLEADGQAQALPNTPIEPADSPEPSPPPELAALLMTSGTRGQPKVVMLSHGNLAFTAAAITEALGLDAHHRIHTALPLHHSYGLYQLWAGLSAGATVILAEGVGLAPRLAEDINRHEATLLPATPTLLRLLLGRTAPLALPTVRLITQAADRLSAAEALQVRAAWPQARLVRMYGLTECGRVSMDTDDDITTDTAAEAACTRVGRPLPGTTARVVDEQGHALPAGHPGRLWVRGPHVMLGYWQDPQATAAAVQMGPSGDGPWLDTGDVLSMDQHGHLHFHGREADRLKTRGERVSAQAVREALLQHAAVLDCAVIGRPHPALGQKIEAHVVLRDGHGADGATLALHCRERLEPSHCPQVFQFWPALPRNEMGKVSTPALLARCP